MIITGHTTSTNAPQVAVYKERSLLPRVDRSAAFMFFCFSTARHEYHKTLCEGKKEPAANATSDRDHYHPNAF